jgi:hypothetical protein
MFGDDAAESEQSRGFGREGGAGDLSEFCEMNQTEPGPTINVWEYF